MASLFSTKRLAGISARHPWKVITAWIVVLAAAALLSTTQLGSVLTNEFTLDTEAESIQGLERLNDAGLDEIAPLSEVVVVSSLTGRDVDSPEFQNRVMAVADDVQSLVMDWQGISQEDEPDFLESLGNLIQGEELPGPTIVSYYMLDALNASEADLFVSDDRATTILVVPMAGGEDNNIQIDQFIAELESFSDDEFQVSTVGTLSVNEQFNIFAEDDLAQGERFGVPMALLMMIVVFGALVAPLLPLVVGVASIVTALGIIVIVGLIVGDMQLFIQNMVAMLGLAVGIDYSLFIVERYREERRAGNGLVASIERTGETATRAVVFSGLTVILALTGVMLIPSNIFRSLGLGAVVVVAVAVLATLTLLPAMLALLKDRINWPRRGSSDTGAATEVRQQDAYAGRWGRLARAMTAKPLLSGGIALVILVSAAYPITDINTGFAGADTLPPSPARTAYETLNNEFSAGLISPVEIVVGGERTSTEPVVAALNEEIQASGLFEPIVQEPTWSADETTAVVEVSLSVPSDSDAAYDAVEQLRNSIIPAAIAEADGVQTWVTGDTAISLDFLDMLSTYTPIVIALVLLLSFVLLTVAFRSLVVPLMAIMMNLLSVGATWGILVLVFQHGFLIDFFGFQPAPIIENWIPILLFAILFGLSMDYHVFLLSRIRESYAQSGNNRESVAMGLRVTAKIITGAAIIMIVVFSAFASGSLLPLQQLGFGLAVAVFIDVTLIRMMLVPATMTLLGHRNWYLPKWLNWLPDLDVDRGTPSETPTPAKAPGEPQPNEGEPVT